MRYLAFLTVVVICAMAWSPWRPQLTGKADSRTPVLVELFTSEGCSSCPPADLFLQKLDAQPISGAQLIVLSEHVDYWNHDGWKDPYSSAFYSDRQNAYAKRFGREEVYTPQMVVDGSSEFVGSNPRLAEKALGQAMRVPKLAVRLSRISVNKAGVQAHVETGLLSPDLKNAEVYAAVVLSHAESDVSRGENAGRKLSHVAVARTFKSVGALQGGDPFSRDIQVEVDKPKNSGGFRLIVFVQEPHQGKVIGAAEEAIPSQ